MLVERKKKRRNRLSPPPPPLLAPSLSLSAQPLYPRTPKLEYQLPGPDQSSHAVKAREETAERGEADRHRRGRGAREEHTHTLTRTHKRQPSFYYSSIVYHPSSPPGTRTAPSLLSSAPHPSGPPDCSCLGVPGRREAGCAMGQACGHALLCRSQPPSSEM